MNVKAILAEMNTTLAVMKIRSEKPPSLPLFLPPSLPPSLSSSLPPPLFFSLYTSPNDKDFYNFTRNETSE